MRRIVTVLLCILCFGGLTAQAQEANSPTPPRSQSQKIVFPVLVFDRARVVEQSETGKALEERIEAARAALLDENNRLYDELETEEQNLADIRDSLSADDFRARAKAFDDKVTNFRSEQDRKAQEIQSQYDEGLTELEKRMNSVLTGIARDYGAVLVFERGQVYLMSGAIDVSSLLIERLDAQEGASDLPDSDAGAADQTAPDQTENGAGDAAESSSATPGQD